eukprot:TRINITY_DN11436_c0_g2_i1.p1 TRINITY_DN11436_c0_g2~~TRINITY_DN11436_c0_g2_i1.p1  ORF type:complete len:337 (-),score=77.46 TRINITY_DN11436_c0_g2_i1:90-1100(-)
MFRVAVGLVIPICLASLAPSKERSGNGGRGGSPVQPLALVQRAATAHGALRPNVHESLQDELPTHSACNVMLLAAVFTTLPNAHWDRTIALDGTFSKTPFGLVQEVGEDGSFSKLHDSLKGIVDSVEKAELDLTIVFDKLPESILAFASPRVQFAQIDPEKYDSKNNSVHMARFFYFRDLVYAQPAWNYVFMLDAFDVTVGKNMCGELDPSTLYVGQDSSDRNVTDVWMVKLYNQLGGKYNAWYKDYAQEHPSAPMLNCGISGGSRSITLTLLELLTEAFADQNTTEPWGSFVSDMSIMNYVVRKFFEGSFKAGAPVNSEFGKFETGRSDVWFIHK